MIETKHPLLDSRDSVWSIYAIWINQSVQYDSQVFFKASERNAPIKM